MNIGKCKPKYDCLIYVGIILSIAIVIFLLTVFISSLLQVRNISVKNLIYFEILTLMFLSMSLFLLADSVIKSIKDLMFSKGLYILSLMNAIVFVIPFIYVMLHFLKINLLSSFLSFISLIILLGAYLIIVILSLFFRNSKAYIIANIMINALRNITHEERIVLTFIIGLFLISGLLYFSVFSGTYVINYILFVLMVYIFFIYPKISKYIDFFELKRVISSILPLIEEYQASDDTKFFLSNYINKMYDLELIEALIYYHMLLDAIKIKKRGENKDKSLWEIVKSYKVPEVYKCKFVIKNFGNITMSLLRASLVHYKTRLMKDRSFYQKLSSLTETFLKCKPNSEIIIPSLEIISQILDNKRDIN